MAGHYVQLTHSDDLGKVTRGFEDAIALSFITNPMKNPTQHEIKRRFKLCDKVFTLLRGDLHWSIPKILDVLPTYLKCELDGVPYNPEDVGASWSAAAVEQSVDVPRLPTIPSVGDPAPADETSTEAEDQAFAGLERDLGITD